MTLRNQINFRILTSILFVLCLSAFLVIVQARNSLAKEINSSVNLAVELIQLGVSESGAMSTELIQKLNKIASLNETRHLNIRIKQPSGELIRLAAENTQRTKNLTPDWFIWAVSGKHHEKSYKVITHNQQSLEILISTDSRDEIDEAWQETGVFFAIILVLSTAVFITVNLVFKNMLNIVNKILYKLNEIANEAYNHNKLPKFSIDEFEQIALAINHLTESLDKAKRENQALTQHSLQIQEEQRQILAQELHDELGQSISAIKVMAVTGKKQSNCTEINNSIISICEHLFVVVRSMMKNLHPLELTELGFKASLQELVFQWHKRNPLLQINLNCNEDYFQNQDKIAIQLFRVIQEALTNTVKHAAANNMSIDIMTVNSETGNMLALTIVDDGKGCDVDSLNKGFGLLSMKSRVKSLDGKIMFHSTEGVGLKIVIKIPFAKQ